MLVMGTYLSVITTLVSTQPGSAEPARKPPKAIPLSRLDPAAWGSDHVGKPPPEYAAGDECLFCHRRDVAPSWARNAHNRTMQVADGTPAVEALRKVPELARFADETRFLLGGRWRQRFLKPAAAYGHVELLSIQWEPEQGKRTGRLLGTTDPHWNATRFGDACAGCHATAVDPATLGFTAHAIDCGGCHGIVDPAHSTDPRRVRLSPARTEPARVVASLCGSCHARGGHSRSTGRPYPNNFVPGDNLFRDFKIDLDAKKLAALNPADRHVQENLRDLAVSGRTQVTCLSCHEVHTQSTARHRSLSRETACNTCHTTQKGKFTLRPYEVHSPTCGY